MRSERFWKWQLVFLFAVIGSVAVAQEQDHSSLGESLAVEESLLLEKFQKAQNLTEQAKLFQQVMLTTTPETREQAVNFLLKHFPSRPNEQRKFASHFSPHLVAALQDSDMWVKRRITRLLNRLGASPLAEYQKVLGMPENHDQQIWILHALSTNSQLSRLSPGQASAKDKQIIENFCQHLAKILPQAPAKLRRGMAYVIARLGWPSQELSQALWEAYQETQEPWLKLYLLVALRKMAKDSEQVMFLKESLPQAIQQENSQEAQRLLEEILGILRQKG